MSARNRTLAAAFTALACSAVGARASANPLGQYGYGSRSTALAGAVTADVQDFSANYYNPAGLVRAPTLRLEFGYFYASHTLMANGQDNHVDPAHGLVGGIVAPGRIFGLPFAFGLGFHLPDERISRSRALPQSQPRWELYDNRAHLFFIAANLAVAPWPWLRIGGGISFISSTRGALDISGTINFISARDSQLFHTVDADLTAVRYPQAGVQVDVLRNLTFGVTYRGSFGLRLELDALVHGEIVLGRPTDPNAARIPGAYSLRSVSTAVFLPQQAAFGLAWRPIPSVTVLADLTWVNWSSYVNPTAQLEAGLDLQIPPGLASFTPPAVPPPQMVLGAGFRDTLVPRVGVEYRRALGVHELALRGGYRYDPTPVPDQTGLTNFMDSSRHAISAGAGFTLRGMRPTLQGGLIFEVHGDVVLHEVRAVTKDDPTDPVGDYTIGGRVLNFGGSVGVIF